MFRYLLYNYISGIIFGILILLVSVLPVDSESAGGLFSFPGADKIVHAGIYGVFTILLTKDYLRINTMKWLNVAILLLAILVYSIVIEMIQLFLTNYRTGEVLDVVANTGGILFGAALVIIYLKIKSKRFANNLPKD